MKNNVLILDDNKEILQELKASLTEKSKLSGPYSFCSEFFGPCEKVSLKKKRSEFYVHYFSQLSEAMATVEKSLMTQNNVKVAFVDFDLGTKDTGLDFIKKIQSIDENIETVLMSAHHLELSELFDDTKFLDRTIFLKKPFYIEEIVQLSRCLTSRYQGNVISSIEKGLKKVA